MFCWSVSLLFFCGLQQEIVASWRKYLLELQDQAEQTNWLLISNFINASDILDWTWFLYCFWLEEFIQKQTFEQVKNFFNPANAQSSSEESVKEKCKMFIGMCSLFTWFNMEILNLCRRWHRRIHNLLKYLKWISLRK